MIEIIYTSTDPGITWNTVKLISDEMKASYNRLRFQAADDIVKYYEEELKKVRAKLNQQENSLTDYNVANKVINYDEQTRAIAQNYEYFATRYEEAEKNYESSLKLIEDVENTCSCEPSLLRPMRNLLIHWKTSLVSVENNRDRNLHL